MRVLSIDGGGIRGIVPALVLAELERRARRPVSDLFDLIAGTSTGGILACALTAPGPGGGPRFTAAELVDLYAGEGPRIFRRSLGRRLLTLDGLVSERYDAAPLREALTRYLDGTRLRETLVPVLVTAYELQLRTPFFFRTVRARTDRDYDFPLVEVAQATSSAPTYWEPHRIGRYSLVDGGVFAPNPAMCAWAEARAARSEPTVVVSLGTGVLTRPIPHERARRWGLVQWARPIIDIVFDGVSDTVDYQLEQILGRDRHFRFQTDLDKASDDLDDASPANLANLRREAEDILEDQSGDLDRALRLL